MPKRQINDATLVDVLKNKVSEKITADRISTKKAAIILTQWIKDKVRQQKKVS